MNLLKEIQASYSYLPKKKAKPIVSMPKEYPAYSLKDGDLYAIAVPCCSDTLVSEHFAHCKFYSQYLNIDGEEQNCLLLVCLSTSSVYEFSVLAAHFVDPGDKGELREKLLSDPIGWWERWRSLLGNSVSEKQVYDVIGEMIVLRLIHEKDTSAKWTAMACGSVDIETKDRRIEVKSTVKRYESLIEVSGQFQLKTDEMDLYFCRFEKSQTGLSIDNLVKTLSNSGYDIDELENHLFSLGLEKGSSIRKETYKVLEIRKYIVDYSFPRITETSFKGDQIPLNILHLKYDIDLNGIEYTKVEFKDG